MVDVSEEFHAVVNPDIDSKLLKRVPIRAVPCYEKIVLGELRKRVNRVLDSFVVFETCNTQQIRPVTFQWFSVLESLGFDTERNYGTLDSEVVPHLLTFPLAHGDDFVY
ncbi:hypothetical protein GCM10009019_20160 [Salarchaeum japonicum]|uniref:HECT domain-containing protein n=1 Tax=Salarchaeum japonicum TaxID=555573 RepID=A0AAV3T241_9EURY